MRLPCIAIGQPLAAGSPWVAVTKELALCYPLPIRFLVPERRDPMMA